MICSECGSLMVETNKTVSELLDEIQNDSYHTRYFCFSCDSLFQCSSDSGDMTEENLEYLGKVEYI